jgi:hypothetical protein
MLNLTLILTAMEFKEPHFEKPLRTLTVKKTIAL